MTTNITTSNKHGVIKGAVAAAAGVAVLLGGAGSFALWNASNSIGSGTTQTGHLSADFGQLAWQDTTAGHQNAIANISGFQLVPGDTLVGTSTISVDVEGENIVIRPEIEYGDDAALPEEISDHLSVAVALTDAGGAAISRITEGDDQNLTAKVTIAYDLDGTSDEMDESIDLSKINISLQQVAPGNA